MLIASCSFIVLSSKLLPASLSCPFYHVSESRFNLYGLNQEVPTFSRCLNIILDYISSDSDSDEVYRDSWTRKDCMDLYGRIHARFLLTARGQELMHQKYLQGDFGYCPRYFCQKQPVLPIGLSETVGYDRVRTFCPKCHQVRNAALSFHCLCCSSCWLCCAVLSFVTSPASCC